MIRYAMDKMRQMDDAYAAKMHELLNSNMLGKALMVNSPYVAGTRTGMSALREIRSEFNNEPMTAADRSTALRQTLAAELGAAGRYGIPAAGAGLGVAGIAGLMGGQPVSPSGPVEIDYSTPAHGSRLSPESHAIYKEVHQGLMNGTVSSEELRAAVGSGKFDHDPLLVAHFMDVMG